MNFFRVFFCIVPILMGLNANAFAASVQLKYSYDNVGRLTKLELDNGKSISYQFDAAANLTKVEHNSVQYFIQSNILPVEGGLVSCSPATVFVGESSTCLATPSQGYRFSKWSGSCIGEQNSCQLTNIQNNLSVTANFIKLISINITSEVSSPDGKIGGFVLQTAQVTEAGQKARFQVKAYAGFKVAIVVTGSCPQGRWLDHQNYETGEITAECNVFFRFDVSSKRKKLPMWLLLQKQS